MYGHAGEPNISATSAPFAFTSQQPLHDTPPKEKSTYEQDWHPKSSSSGKLPPPYSRNCSFDHDDSSFPSDEKDDVAYGFDPALRNGKQYQSREDRRTLVFKGLSDRTTHKDIVDVISGGALLDIFLRPRERMASVSFVEGAAAQDFFTYTRRNDIYIRGKRVLCSKSMVESVLNVHRLRWLGMIANSFSQIMLLTKLPWELQGTLRCTRSVHPSLLRASVRTWTTSTIWSSLTLGSRMETLTSH